MPWFSNGGGRMRQLLSVGTSTSALVGGWAIIALTALTARFSISVTMDQNCRGDG
jgi:hypothetical protein